MILHDVDASFTPGSLTAIMGPSGAGKTTLLSVLRSGRCTSGRVALNGLPHSGSVRQLIKTIPQDDILLQGLTAREMLTFGARLSRVPLARFGSTRTRLAHLHDRRRREHGGGEAPVPDRHARRPVDGRREEAVARVRGVSQALV